MGKVGEFEKNDRWGKELFEGKLRHFFWGESLQTLLGGNISLFTELCEKTRADAFDIMMKHAESLGANAVIGVRYDANEVMQGVTEVLCYGTAVLVEPISK